jgi:hypothetical protein
MKKVSILNIYITTIVIFWQSGILFGHLVAIWNISRKEKSGNPNADCPGANPTIVSYNASVVKVYNTINSTMIF